MPTKKLLLAAVARMRAALHIGAAPVAPEADGASYFYSFDDLARWYPIPRADYDVLRDASMDVQLLKIQAH